MSADERRAPSLDSHQHFWKLARGDYRWLTPDLTTLYRDFEPADLAPQLREAQVDASVLVQAADSVAETEFLLAVARETEWVAGVVGWVDLDHEAAPRELERLAREPKFVGVRPMLQELDDPRWILRPHVLETLRAAAQLGLRFDALVKPPQLAALCELRARVPELWIVVDHAAKPRLVEGENWHGFSQWQAQLRELAGHPLTFCKISGLLTECGPTWSSPQLSHVFEFAREAFGAERLMWGSDWPVVEICASYARWRNISEELTRAWKRREHDEFFGATAARFYGLSVHHRLGPGR